MLGCGQLAFELKIFGFGFAGAGECGIQSMFCRFLELAGIFVGGVELGHAGLQLRDLVFQRVDFAKKIFCGAGQSLDLHFERRFLELAYIDVGSARNFGPGDAKIDGNLFLGLARLKQAEAAAEEIYLVGTQGPFEDFEQRDVIVGRNTDRGIATNYGVVNVLAGSIMYAAENVFFSLIVLFHRLLSSILYIIFER